MHSQAAVRTQWLRLLVHVCLNTCLNTDHQSQEQPKSESTTICSAFAGTPDYDSESATYDVASTSASDQPAWCRRLLSDVGQIVHWLASGRSVWGDTHRERQKMHEQVKHVCLEPGWRKASGCLAPHTLHLDCIMTSLQNLLRNLPYHASSSTTTTTKAMLRQLNNHTQLECPADSGRQGSTGACCTGPPRCH